MRLSHLKLQNVRNLAALELEFSNNINYFSGKNGAGKTSLLESVHLLACGRSFRTNHIAHCVRREAQGLQITGSVVGDWNQATHLGIEFQQPEARIRMRAAGQPVRRTSDLARHYPLLALHQETQQLLSQGPRQRRRFLDWGLFHVEPQFHDHWRRYHRALKQRNGALQAGHGDRELAGWEQELATTGMEIDRLRRAYVEALVHQLGPLLAQMTTIDAEIRCDYRPGWDQKRPLIQVLAESRAKDRLYGYTRSGPHSADLALYAHGDPLKDQVSRGQQKLLAYALYLAQASLYKARTGQECALLIDDLGAELDPPNAGLMLRLLQAMGVQLFVTTTDRALFQGPDVAEGRMFHVEQGAVREMV